MQRPARMKKKLEGKIYFLFLVNVYISQKHSDH